MAITGTKLFTSGEILTSTDVNQYLMRGIKVFATSTARDNAYGGAGEPTLEEGECCYLLDSNVVQYYNGSAWISVIDQSVVDAKGDLLAATAADTVTRLAVGANSTYLRANSAAATGLEWGALPVTAIDSAQITTSQSTSSTSYTDLATAGPSVTLTTGTSAIVLFGARYNDDGNLGNDGYISYAVSGSTTIAASDNYSCFGHQGFGGEMNVPLNYQHKVTGLTAGSNTFTLKYRKSGGTSTAGFLYRFITVIAL